MTLPRRSGMQPLGDSRPQALQGYQANEKSLLRKGTLQAFQAVVKEYLDLGHAEPVPTNQLNISPKETYYYLPMHGVVKDSCL